MNDKKLDIEALKNTILRDFFGQEIDPNAPQYVPDNEEEDEEEGE